MPSPYGRRQQSPFCRWSEESGQIYAYLERQVGQDLGDCDEEFSVHHEGAGNGLAEGVGAPGKAGNQVKSKEAAAGVEGRIAERLFCKSRRKNCKSLV